MVLTEELSTTTSEDNCFFIVFHCLKTNILIFNPQNDLALATGGINYVAPPFALQMASDLAVLPAWVAQHGSRLITDSDLDAQWLTHLDHTFGLGVTAIKRNELRHLTDYRIMPWGWCLDLRRRLIKWGASSNSVLTKDEIYHLRGLSHRRVTVLIHLRLQELLGKQLCPIPVELAVPDEVDRFVSRHRQCFIKTPWSSSGRGIYHTTGGSTPEFRQWCSGALKRQGSLLCEVALDKVMDLAVEFHSHDKKATVRGYSVFHTDSHSQYQHGIVASTATLKEKITTLYPTIDTVVDALTHAVNEMVAPHYDGWFGVDMLLFKDGQGTGINPCVELNLRPTMGAITSVLGDTVVAPGTTGTFVIEHRSSNTAPWPQHQEAVIENGRLTSGTMQLTTPSPQALYRAILTID